MVRSVSVFFKSFTRKFTGKKRLLTHSGKIDTKTLRSAYEVLIQYKKDNIQQYKNAVGMLIAQVENRKCSLRNVTDDINKFKRILVGVKNKINTLTVELQQAGMSQEEIEQHSDYIRFLSEYNAIQSCLDERNARLSKLQQDVKKAEDKVEPFKLQMMKLHLEISKIQEEQEDTIQDHLSILMDKEIADVLAGIR